MGLALHNGYDKPPSWGYVFGLFTGINARASHALGISLAYGEKVDNPSDLNDPGDAAEFHPELFLRLSYNADDIKPHTDSDEERTGLRYGIGLSTAWDIDPVDYIDFALRLSPEVILKYRGLSFCTVGYAGFSEIGADSDMELAMTGGLVQAEYRFDETFEISLRYAVVDYRDKLLDDARTRASMLIDDSGDDPDVVEQYGGVGSVSKERELTAGFNIYMKGHSLKWQNDFGWLKHLRDDGNRNDYVARSQFQIGF
jgi:hypothetical protein